MRGKDLEGPLPSMQGVAPVGTLLTVEETVPVNPAALNFGDPEVRFVAMPGTRGRASVLDKRNSARLRLPTG